MGISADEDGHFEVRYLNGDAYDGIPIGQLRKTFVGTSNVILSPSDIQNAVEVVCGNIVGKELYHVKNIGDGSINIVQWTEGSVAVLWDGKNHVDINLFTYNEGKDFHDRFVSQFEKQIPSLKVALHDTQPRGVGRVINFSDDVEPHLQNKPRWA